MTRRITVFHGSYGCDTGCCGHWVELEDDDKKTERFAFSHAWFPGGTGGSHKGDELTDEDKVFIRDLVTSEFGEDHCADIDWAHCLVSDD